MTYGRLLIPDANFCGLLCLLGYALVRALWLQGDLNNHDLHHIGQGPWTEAPYVRTRLLMDGVPLRQTIDVRAMFQVAFDAAAQPSHSPDGISDEEILGM